MSVPPLPDCLHLHREVQQLLQYTDALIRSGSKMEDDFWENKLINTLDRIITGKDPHLLETLFEFLGQQQLHAHYEILAGLAEGLAESCQLEHEQQAYDALLISIPITAWTRYQLPHGELKAKQIADVEQALRAHVLNPDAKLAIVNHLLSFDQLPANFNETRQWLNRLAKRSLEDGSSELNIKKDDEAIGLFADARFILLAAVVPKGDAIFRWQLEHQHPEVARLHSIHQWENACHTILDTSFTGCTTHYALPNAFYISNREADKQMRPLTIKAAITWLEAATQVSLSDLVVVIAPCGEEQIEEYRIGFNTEGSTNALYGAIWPILSPDETDTNSADYLNIPNEIASLLKEFEVGEIRLLPGLYLPETCDDCGAPYFPNATGDMAHPDLPEEINLDPLQLH